MTCSVEGVGRVKGPEYETIGLMGTNLEIPDLKKVAEWSYLADDLGMDTISLGSVLAFTMELQERGMLDAGLHFGDAAGVSDMIKDIGHRRGLGNDLADGVKRMSEKYGGTEFAIHVKGLELSAYDPRGSYRARRRVRHHQPRRLPRSRRQHVPGVDRPADHQPAEPEAQGGDPDHPAEPRLRHQLHGAVHVHHLRPHPEGGAQPQPELLALQGHHHGLRKQRPVVRVWR